MELQILFSRIDEICERVRTLFFPNDHLGQGTSCPHQEGFHGDDEGCFYGWKERAAHYLHPEIHNATDVWEIKKVNPQSMIHLTEKPVELAVRAMTYSSQPKENVLD